MVRSRLAVAAGALGALALFDIVLGPLLANLGVVSPMFAFQWIFGLGLLVGLIGLLLGLGGLYTTREVTRRAGRGLAWLGVLAGCAVIVILGGAVGGRGDVPTINDITTNPEDPPLFSAALRQEPNQGRDMSYPSEFASLQRAGYPDLAPIEVPEPPAEAFERALAAARELGWEIVESRPAAREFEAREVSRLFRFVDDIAVRVRPTRAGSVVDVRSKSRDGRSDLGVNAARIDAFRTALGASAS